MKIGEPTEQVFLDKSDEDPHEDPREDLIFLKIVDTLLYIPSHRPDPLAFEKVCGCWLVIWKHVWLLVSLGQKHVWLLGSHLKTFVVDANRRHRSDPLAFE